MRFFAQFIIGRIAEILQKPDDRERYLACAKKARSGYRALVKTKRYSPDTDRQAKLVRPLYLKLLDEEQTAYAKKRLITALDNYGWRLGTGFLSTPLILYVLAEMDIAYAYRLLENEEIPGWLSMPKAGANTIWEAWEGPNSASGGIGSLNHYSKGAVVEWLFGGMCGIRPDGENHFVIAPKPGGRFTFASAEYKSIYGVVRSGWEKTENGWRYRIEIPSNCTAEIALPDGTKKKPAKRSIHVLSAKAKRILPAKPAPADEGYGSGVRRSAKRRENDGNPLKKTIPGRLKSGDR